jgi:hypothetical protein
LIKSRRLIARPMAKGIIPAQTNTLEGGTSRSGVTSVALGNER